MGKDRFQSIFDVANITGLSEASVAVRLREEGYNELPSSQQRSVLMIALEVVREPMFPPRTIGIAGKLEKLTDR